MDNFDDIQQVWLSADVSALPKAAGIMQTIKKYRLKQMLKTAGFIVLILVLFLMMCWVLFAYHSTLITTRIGEGCLLLALIILLSVNVWSLQRIASSKAYSNNQFLLFLKQEKLRLIRFQQRTQPIGFAFASIGLSFYIFEEVHHDLWVMIMSYAGVILWCCFSWFIIRRKAMTRKTKKLNETIAKLEQFSKQLQNQSN